MDCEVCNKIISVYEDANSEDTPVDLGAYDVLMSGNCSQHIKLLQNNESQHQDIKDSNTALRRKFPSRVEIKRRNDNIGLHEFFFESEVVIDFCIIGVFEKIRFDPLETGRGLVIDPQWIDLDRVKKWIRTCSEHHGVECTSRSTAYGSTDVRPRLLVDVQNKCLVEGTVSESYVALSYVWGSAKSMLTLGDNIEDLKQYKALEAEETWLQLPLTVRHAIILVEKLGETHLWVDSLCIVQDDIDLKMSEINNMVNIFANASVVVIAAEGDSADHGIQGLQSISGPRSVTQYIYEIGTFQFAHRVTPQASHMSTTGDTYGTRGWTFQEHALSHRRIIFTEYGVRWECCKAAWYEDVEVAEPGGAPDGLEPTQEIARIQQILSREKFDVHAFEKVISPYNERAFSFPEDVTAAFAGIASILTKKSGGGFFFGLPVLSFDTALLWQPLLRWFMYRRCPTNGSSLPTWSWVGWVCELDDMDWSQSVEDRLVVKLSHNLTGLELGREVVSTVTWYCVNNDKSIVLPLKSLEGSQVVGDHSQRFSFALLSGQTRRCRTDIHLGRRVRNMTWRISQECRGWPFHYQILDRVDRVIGIINVPPTSIHSHEKSSDPPQFDQKISGDIPVDMVEISRQRISVLSESEPWPQQNTVPDEWQTMLAEMVVKSENGVCDLVNVLWVTWKDGIAQRKALGWIEREAWHGLNLEDIDLTLG